MYRLILGCVILLLVVGAKFAPAAQQQDFSKVEIKTQKVAGNIYMLEGSGGNIGVSAGPDGLLMIDDQFAPLADKIKASLKALNSGQLKFLVNSHYHGDHTGSNAAFGTDATIIAHSNVRKRLNVGSSTAKAALPIITFDKSLSVHFNGEEIRVTHYPSGHTDGDSIIYFTGSNVVHMGDDFVTYGFPFVDTASGGDVIGMTKTVKGMIDTLPADVKIIPGHGPICSIADMQKFHAMLTETTDIVRKEMSEGKTLDQIKATGLPEKYKSLGTGFVKTDAWVTAIYNSLNKKK